VHPAPDMRPRPGSSPDDARLPAGSRDLGDAGSGSFVIDGAVSSFGVALG